MNIEERKEAILKEARRAEVKFVLMQFMDILGTVKCVTVPATRLERVLSDGVVFDGSSVVGYATIEESDMRAVPDTNTFQVLPWTEGATKSARLICDIYDTKGRRHSGDPRYILQRVLDRAREKGWVCNTGPEYEFFLFKQDESGGPTTAPIDSGHYFDLLPEKKGQTTCGEIASMLDQMNFNVEAFHHEVSTGQYEIDLRYADAMASADRVMTLKYAIKTIALGHGFHATFMPKPVFGINGSGMHVHQSLTTPKGENTFYDPSKGNGLSDTMMWYMGGILKYARETCAVLASTVNSYKRLVPGFEAPVYISWASMNRSALVRVPAGRGMSTRMEVRNPDPAGNPYLQYAVMLGAGLKGIEEKTIPREAVETDIFHLPAKEKERMGIGSLPGNLEDALDELEKSELMRDILGAHIFTHFLYVKRKEWDEYRVQVTDWEVKRYLPVL